MRTILSIPLFVAAFIITVSSDSTASALNTGNLKMHSESAPVVLIVNKDQFEGN